MKTTPVLLVCLFSFGSLAVGPARAQDAPPDWAYPVNPPDFQRTPDDGSVRHVPDSTAGFTLTQVRDLFAAPDWHPGDHPPMPEVVAHGRKPNVFACGVCHRADGPGGPESASLSGLPADYIIQQTQNFKAGRRTNTAPRVAVDLMIKAAKDVTDEELQAAAGYFSSIRPRPNISVVETETVPTTRVRDLFLASVEDGNHEAIGQRIIEIPEKVEDFISRDSHARFIAYVPIGSIDRGRTLAANSDPRVHCAGCHGADLRGAASVPGLAGRSPTYMFRQLFDFRSGARQEATGDSMKQAVESLTVTDMIALAAFTASLQP